MSDLIDYNPCTSVFKCKHIKTYVCEKSIQQLRIDPGQIVRQLKFDQHFKKPNPDACDIRSYGDTAIINPPKKHKDTGKDIHFMVIYVMAPKPCRITISMSFSGFRINTQPDHFIDRGFGDLVKKFCNNESDSGRKATMRSKKRSPQKYYPNPISSAAAELVMMITKKSFIKKKDPTDFDVSRWTDQGRVYDKIISNKRNHPPPIKPPNPPRPPQRLPPIQNPAYRKLKLPVRDQKNPSHQKIQREFKSHFFTQPNVCCK